MIRLMVKLFVLLAMSALTTAYWGFDDDAQDETTEITVEPSAGLTVGDPISIRIRIGHDLGERVLIGGTPVEMGAMEPSVPVITALSATQTQVIFQTRAFTTGAFNVKLPAIAIRSTNETLREISVPLILITVNSLLSEDAQPRPSTDPDLIEGDPQTFTPWIVAIIGIGLGFIAAQVTRRWRRRRATSEPQEASASPRVPLVAFELNEALDAPEQCQQLSTAVRARLSRDWSLPATALTTSEIGPALASAGAPGLVVLRVTRLLEACDRVQFGGEQPTPERLRGYLQLAEAIWEDAAVT